MSVYLVTWKAQVEYSAEFDDSEIDGIENQSDLWDYLEDNPDTLIELSSDRNWVNTEDDIEIFMVEDL